MPTDLAHCENASTRGIWSILKQSDSGLGVTKRDIGRKGELFRDGDLSLVSICSPVTKSSPRWKKGSFALCVPAEALIPL